jgi:hypothetical protein
MARHRIGSLLRLPLLPLLLLLLLLLHLHLPPTDAHSRQIPRPRRTKRRVPLRNARHRRCAKFRAMRTRFAPLHTPNTRKDDGSWCCMSTYALSVFLLFVRPLHALL